MRDEGLRKSLAEQGRVRVEFYGWPRVAQQVLSYYERLLDTREGVESSRDRRIVAAK